MTTFEQELRKIFGNDALFSDTKYVGRTCYGRLDGGLRVRAEFVTLGCADQFAALKISLINRNEGVVDSALLRFDETLGFKKVGNPNFKEGVSPHLWKNGRILEWYVYQPTPADFEKLAGMTDDYLEVFREPVQAMAQAPVSEPPAFGLTQQRG